MKKFLSIILAITTVAAIITGCGNGESDGASASTAGEKTEKTVAGESNEDPVVRIGTLASQIQPALASKLGYFDEEGVKVEIVVFDAGPAEVEAFTSGDLDIIQVGDLPFLNGVNNGVDLQIIGFYQSSTKDCQLGVRDDAKIQSFADLKGKTVSVPFGSNAQPLLYEMLESGGLKPEDVELVNLTAADGANALVSGSVDAAISWDPFIQNVVSQGGVTVFADSSEFRPLVCPIASSSAFVEKNREAVGKVLNALNKAAAYAKENVNESADLVAEYFGADSSDSYVLSINNKDLDVRITDEKINAIKKGAAKSYEYGLIESEVNIDDHVIKGLTD